MIPRIAISSIRMHLRPMRAITRQSAARLIGQALWDIGCGRVAARPDAGGFGDVFGRQGPHCC